MNLKIDLDRSSPVPLYLQLAQQLEDAIAQGRLRPGDRLETEVELAHRHGLSRPTVRQAIQELVSAGLLIRRRGVGTQVVQAQVRRQLGLTSLFDDLSAEGHRPRTDVLSVDLEPADPGVADALQIPLGTTVVHVERVRFDGAEPLAHMRNWLCVDPDAITARSLSDQGLYQLLRAAGIHLRIARQRIGARAATTEEGRLLRVRKGSPLLTMQRIAFDDSGRPIEFASHAYRADSYSFETTLTDR